MVASRKPKRNKGERRPGESLEQMFQRITAGVPPSGEFLFDHEEAIYVLDRLSREAKPVSDMTGDEIVKRFYGLWPAPGAEAYPD